MVRLLAALGTGFDCASLQEIRHVMQTGIDPSRIIFANPCKSVSFIKHAAAAGVDMMTFDNTDELYKIARVHPAAKLVVRILTDDSKSLCRLGLKFGAPLGTVPALLSTARSLDLDVIGVSFHVGSGSYDSNAFAGAVMRARAAFDMGAEAGYCFKLLDVGGGFESATFEATSIVLARALEVHFPFARKEGIKIIAEPGRYFVSSAFSLAANVIARRVKHVGAADTPLEIEGLVSSTTEDQERQPSVMCKHGFPEGETTSVTVAYVFFFTLVQIILTTACMARSIAFCSTIRKWPRIPLLSRIPPFLLSPKE